MAMENLILENELLTQQVKQQTQETQRHAERLTAINKVAAVVSQSLDLDKTLTTALEVVTGVIGAEAGGISMIDEETDEVVLRAQLGWEQDFVSPPMRIPAGRGMSGKVIQSDAVLVVSDLQGSTDIAVPRFQQEPFRSMVLAPMHARGKIIGILSIMSQQPNHFDNATIDLLRGVADTVGVALDNAQLYQNSVENENRLSAVLQSTADGIITTDTSGVIRLVNPSAERLLEIMAADVVDRPLRDAPIPEAFLNPLRLALSSRDESPEKSFQVKLGSGRVLMVFISPVCEGNNPLKPDADTQDGWVIVLQDVTHLRKAEEMRAQFIQAAAHDMRNPLGVTMTSLGTLQSIITDDLAQEVVDVALSGVNRMQRLLDDLLNLERIESGYQFHLDDIDLLGVIHEVCGQMQPLLEQKSQTHEVSTQGIPTTIQADPHWFSRALTNYVSNATKYTPQGGRIYVKAFTREGFVHIEVMDNGPGIPLDVQSRLFERFYRVKDASQERGSGLGLAIVKSVIEAHGGSVYMRSKVGEGSTFGMALPAARG
jgi:two-component system, NtrC family, sensor histidine kinase KinB